MTEPHELANLWLKADAAELGIAVPTNDRKLLQQQLYKYRLEVGGFEDIHIVIPPKEDEIWLIKRMNR